MLKGYIFDYGGTLDTRGNHWGKVMWHAYEHCDIAVSEAQFREAYVHTERTLGRQRIILPDDTFRITLRKKLILQLAYLVEKGMVECNVEEKADLLLAYLYDNVCETVAASRQVLLQLKSQGYPMVLVSNFYGNVKTVLREFHLDGIFQQIIESAVVGIRKPDPQIFMLGVQALNLQPDEVMVVGDSVSKDILPAKSLGCMTTWIKGEPWDASEAEQHVADAEIEDLNELLSM